MEHIYVHSRLLSIEFFFFEFINRVKWTQDFFFFNKTTTEDEVISSLTQSAFSHMLIPAAQRLQNSELHDMSPAMTGASQQSEDSHFMYRSEAQDCKTELQPLRLKRRRRRKLSVLFWTFSFKESERKKMNYLPSIFIPLSHVIGSHWVTIHVQTVTYCSSYPADKDTALINPGSMFH